MSEAMGIGFFQFDNLVRNRVPFALVKSGSSFEEIYSGPELQHLSQYTLPLDPSFSILDIIMKLQAQHYRAQDPVICICPSGSESKLWANELEKRGFRNCYFVEGGFAALLMEYRESK